MVCQPDMVDELLKLAGTGATDYLLAEAVGVSPPTFSNWRRAAEDGDQDLAKLFEGIDRARARGAMVLIVEMRKAATGGDWRAGQSLLRHLHSRDFTDKRVVDTKPESAPDAELPAGFREFSGEDFAEAARYMMERKAARLVADRAEPAAESSDGDDEDED